MVNEDIKSNDRWTQGCSRSWSGYNRLLPEQDRYSPATFELIHPTLLWDHLYFCSPTCCQQAKWSEPELNLLPSLSSLRLLFLCPNGSDSKESACSAGDPGLILGSGRSPGEGNGNPLQYSCLENSMNRGACQLTVPEITKVLDMTQLPKNNKI